MKIIIDAMGGDNAPFEIIQGAIDALKEIDDLKLQLDNDRNVNLIKEKNKYIKTLQRQREILREENLRLINNG